MRGRDRSAHQQPAIERQLVEVVSELKQYLKILIAVAVAVLRVARQCREPARRPRRWSGDLQPVYQPDIDIATMEPASQAHLSTSDELLLRLRWLAILYGRIRPRSSRRAAWRHLRTDQGAAGRSGRGASGLAGHLRPGLLGDDAPGLERWMEQHEISHIDDMRGRASLKDVVDRARSSARTTSRRSTARST
jgi:hypothetical protein